MTRLKLVTWNINSVRLRAPNVAAFVQAEAPDVICLQETKCLDDQFPVKAFHEMGMEHLVLCGQHGGHHGVAIASRLPLEPIDPPAKICREGHARVCAAKVAGVEIHNIYLPAGGDEPDPDKNPKFAHKLDFVGKLGRAYGKLRKDEATRILVGDLNIAPHESDVWSHKQLLKIVSHTPVETESLEKARKKGGWADIARLAHPDEQRLYTWWSYRAKDWAASNKGRRLDHIWADERALPNTDLESYRIHIGWRGGWKPSDHAPVSVEIKT